MAKLVTLNNAMDTVKKWATQFKALTFEDNFQNQIRIQELAHGDSLVYDGIDKIFKNGPRFESWVPDFSLSTAPAFTLTSLTYARYTEIGKLVFGAIYATGTTSGGAGTAIRVKAPVMPAINTQINFARVRDAAAGVSVDGVMNTNTNDGGTLDFYQTGVGNWTNGTGRIIISTFMYEGL